MGNSYEHAAPPVRHAPGLECEHINNGKYPSIDQVDKKAIQLGFVAIGRHHCAQQVGKVHAGELQSLRARLHSGEQHRTDESPQKPVLPVHLATSCAVCTAASRCGSWRLPSTLSCKDRAAPIRPMWVNPWGKFPSASPEAGSISSA